MPLCRYRIADGDASARLGLIVGDRVLDVGAGGGPADMADALNLGAVALRSVLENVAEAGDAGTPLADVTLLAPLDRQEVWAAGVTYLRSRDARMEESTTEDVYERVYKADRPELFFKATASRVADPGQAVAIRGDSTWDVPEPELALALSAAGETIGYTIGNDVSSRSIEGENPLYLPQAKVYRQCAGLGPVVALVWEVEDVKNLPIRLTIRRGDEAIFTGESSTNQIHRTFEDLVAYLLRHNDLPHGVFLMTGTGIIPPSEFTLEDGDEVEIAIEGIGALVNPVVRLAD